MHYLEQHLERLTAPNVISDLHSFFTCNISEAMKKETLDPWPSMVLLMKMKRRFGYKYGNKSLIESCEDRPVKVIKTIRTRVSWLKPLLNSLQDLKVIHLLRDPRATIPSGIKQGWFSINASKELCDYVKEDLHYGEQLQNHYPERLVVYARMYSHNQISTDTFLPS
ncbi:hypothetical protein Pcinc_021154 [Petrolisthes cinctipes]|uniref:Uncharacterized protein n=1 Tax=Petrolisthes cinctipes TaxID=88211 RepID=A0AAE1KIT2_PETCI|nr:hypothetical protein Pcinc_021154 [Petrolisthes cinctipes]